MAKSIWASHPQLPPDDRIIKSGEATINGIPLSKYKFKNEALMTPEQIESVEQETSEMNKIKDETKGVE